MTTEHKTTSEQRAFGNLSTEKRGKVTKAASELYGIAAVAAYGCYLIPGYSFQPEQFYTADHNMLHLANALTEHDREVLAEVAQAARAASDSLDKHDYETPAGFRIYVADLYWYYATIADMVEKALKPTSWEEIDSAQFELWRDYAKRWPWLDAEAPGTQQGSDESLEDLPF
jgi:hypothetical protein